MKVIILDRDGVINFDSPNYIKHPDEWEPIPQSLAAVAQLNQAGFKVAIASNQSGIARGLYDETVLAAIHEKMQKMLEQEQGFIDYIVYCPHLPNTGCSCRKPLPGMLEEIARHFQCSLKNIPFVGDKLTDVETAIAACAKPIVVKTGYQDETAEIISRYPNIEIYKNLWDFVQTLV